MKKIYLQPDDVITREKKGYSVHLGNGTVHMFTSKREAFQFVGQVNTFLTQQFYQIRFIYIEVWNKVQECWSHFDSFSTEASCFDNLQSANNLLERVIRKCINLNQYYLKFSELRRAMLFLKNVLKILRQEDKKRSNTLAVYEYDCIFERLLNIEICLEKYGQSGKWQNS